MSTSDKAAPTPDGAAGDETTDATDEGLRCVRHPQRAAIAVCTRCQAPMCLACHTSDGAGLAVCRRCVESSEAAAEAARAEIDQKLAVPFEAPDKGVAERLLDTIRMLVTHPTAFFQRVALSPQLARPFIFGFLCVAVGLVAVATWQVVLDIPAMEVPESLATEGVEPLAPSDLLMMIPLAATMQLGISTVMLHLAARIVGGRARLGKTFQIVAYASLCQLLLVFPYVGAVLALVAQLVLQFKGVRAVHGLSPGRAALACVLPVAVVVLLGGGI